MEILTTLIKFRCKKDCMNEQTSNAQIFLFKGSEGTTKVFVPKSKLIVKDDDVSDDFNICVMPKWAFMKQNNLAEHVEIVGETQHMEVINDIED